MATCFVESDRIVRACYALPGNIADAFVFEPETINQIPEELLAMLKTKPAIQSYYAAGILRDLTPKMADKLVKTKGFRRPKKQALELAVETYAKTSDPEQAFEAVADAVEAGDIEAPTETAEVEMEVPSLPSPKRGRRHGVAYDADG